MSYWPLAPFYGNDVPALVQPYTSIYQPAASELLPSDLALVVARLEERLTALTELDRVLCSLQSAAGCKSKAERKSAQAIMKKVRFASPPVLSPMSHDELDDYDYSQHLRSRAGGPGGDDSNVYKANPEDLLKILAGKNVDPESIDALVLPPDMVASAYEEDVRLLNRAAPVSG